MESYIDKLNEWTDIDIALHKLASNLGLIDENKGSFAVEYKWIYWNNNKYGDALYGILMKLVDIGLIEYDSENDKVRSISNFRFEK